MDNIAGTGRCRREESEAKKSSDTKGKDTHTRPPRLHIEFLRFSTREQLPSILRLVGNTDIVNVRPEEHAGSTFEMII
jgi:hypothetical protein